MNVYERRAARQLLPIVLIVGVVLLCAVSTAGATTYRLTGTGSWTSPSTWDAVAGSGMDLGYPGSLTSTTDVAIVPAAHAASIVSNVPSIRLAELRFEAPGATLIGGTDPELHRVVVEQLVGRAATFERLRLDVAGAGGFLASPGDPTTTFRNAFLSAGVGVDISVESPLTVIRDTDDNAAYRAGLRATDGSIQLQRTSALAGASIELSGAASIQLGTGASLTVEPRGAVAPSIAGEDATSTAIGRTIDATGAIAVRLEDATTRDVTFEAGLTAKLIGANEFAGSTVFAGTTRVNGSGAANTVASGGLIENVGEMLLAGASAGFVGADATATFHNTSSGSLHHADGAHIARLELPIANDGELALGDGSARGSISTNGHYLTTNAGGSIRMVSSGGRSSLNLDGQSTGSLILNGGTLSGTGDIAGPVHSHGGTVAVDRNVTNTRMSGGALAVTGLHLDAASTLLLHANGPFGYSTLNTGSGPVHLAGTLNMVLESGYVPLIGAQFIAIGTTEAAPTWTGDFAAIQVNGLSSPRFLAASNGAPAYTLTSRQASLNVGPSVVRPGESFTVTGASYQPGETVTVRLAIPERGVAAATSVVADASGAFSTVIPVAANMAAGPVQIAAQGARSGVLLSVDTGVTAHIVVIVPDTDGDGITDDRDCAISDAKRPAKGVGIVDVDCNGVNDLIQPVKFAGSKRHDKFTGKGGPDKINGGAGNDVLAGGGGNDVIDGGIGNDKLDGGVGKDTLKGGAGTDTIKSSDGERDVVTCGPGKDVVTADPLDKVAKDCERVIRTKAKKR